MLDSIPPNAFAYAVTVRPEEVDVQGRVANHEYVRMLIDAAIAHSTHLGWDTDAYRELGAWWVVRRHEIDYFTPAVEGDQLICYTWPSGFSKAKAARSHVMVRPSDGALVLRAMNVWALIDIETSRPRRIAAALLETFDPAQWVGPGRGA